VNRLGAGVPGVLVVAAAAWAGESPATAENVCRAAMSGGSLWQRGREKGFPDPLMARGSTETHRASAAV
jgi:hypothetical protein